MDTFLIYFTDPEWLSEKTSTAGRWALSWINNLGVLKDKYGAETSRCNFISLCAQELLNYHTMGKDFLCAP